MSGGYAWSWADYEREAAKEAARPSKELPDTDADIHTAVSARGALRHPGSEGGAPEGTRGTASVRRMPPNAPQTRAPTPVSAVADPEAMLFMDHASRARWLKAKRKAVGAKPAKAKPVALEPALTREACDVCGIPGFRGCAHQLPCEDAPHPNQRELEPYAQKTVGTAYSRWSGL